jgi:hypothetical protein
MTKAVNRSIAAKGKCGEVVVSLRKFLAPQVGLEPTTLRLTAECSAIELLRSVLAGNVLNCL